MNRSRSRGQSSVEYVIAVSLLALALTVGPDSVLRQLFDAFAQRYAAYTYAVSRP